MPKHKQTEPENSASEKSGSEPSVAQWPVRRIKRSQINLAPYNPRSISDYARQQLSSSLRKFRLVETLVWNEQTGNLVSGHQRMSIFDEQFGFPENDYTIEVSVVDISLRKEKELNVWLNNRAAQGNFDRDLFIDFMNSEPDMELGDLGLTKMDLDFDFGGEGGFEDILGREKKQRDDLANSIDAIKKRKKVAKEDDNGQPEQETDYFLMIVFPSKEAKDTWLKEHNFSRESRYLSHAEYEAALKPQTTEAKVA